MSKYISDNFAFNWLQQSYVNHVASLSNWNNVLLLLLLVNKKYFRKCVQWNVWF